MTFSQIIFTKKPKKSNSKAATPKKIMSSKKIIYKKIRQNIDLTKSLDGPTHFIDKDKTTLKVPHNSETQKELKSKKISERHSSSLIQETKPANPQKSQKKMFLSSCSSRSESTRSQNLDLKDLRDGIQHWKKRNLENLPENLKYYIVESEFSNQSQQLDSQINDSHLKGENSNFINTRKKRNRKNNSQKIDLEDERKKNFKKSKPKVNFDQKMGLEKDLNFFKESRSISNHQSSKAFPSQSRRFNSVLTKYDDQVTITEEEEFKEINSMSAYSKQQNSNTNLRNSNSEFQQNVKSKNAYPFKSNPFPSNLKTQSKQNIQISKIEIPNSNSQNKKQKKLSNPKPRISETFKSNIFKKTSHSQIFNTSNKNDRTVKNSFNNVTFDTKTDLNMIETNVSSSDANTRNLAFTLQKSNSDIKKLFQYNKQNPEKFKSDIRKIKFNLNNKKMEINSNPKISSKREFIHRRYNSLDRNSRRILQKNGLFDESNVRSFDIDFLNQIPSNKNLIGTHLRNFSLDEELFQKSLYEKTVNGTLFTRENSTSFFKKKSKKSYIIE